MKNAGWDHVHVGELKRYSFSTWPFLFSCVSTTFWGICPANKGPFTEAPDEIYRGGLLARMFMGHNSDSHFPLHRDLLYFLMDPKHLPQCLGHRKCSVNVCWTDDLGVETNGGNPPVLEAGAGPCRLRSCGQPHSIRETEEPGQWRPRLGERGLGLPPRESLVPALRPFQAANYCLWINSFVCASTSSRVLAQAR